MKAIVGSAGIEEVPKVNCQEQSLEELKQTLAVTLKEALALNPEDALAAAGPDYTKETIRLTP